MADLQLLLQRKPYPRALLAIAQSGVEDQNSVGHSDSSIRLGSGILCDGMTSVDINITAGKEQVGEPWLWKLGRNFNLQVNLRKANIDDDYGWVQVELTGPIEEIQRATAWLMTTGMHVEALQRAVGA